MKGRKEVILKVNRACEEDTVSIEMHDCMLLILQILRNVDLCGVFLESVLMQKCLTVHEHYTGSPAMVYLIKTQLAVI